jgi:alanine racemase
MANTATLTVDLAALTENYQLLKSKHAKKNIGTVVKANAYGLGVERVSQRFAELGCEKFFVATLAEAIELRGFLPNVNIAVFSGVFAGEENDYKANKITPVINRVEQFDYCKAIPSILHVDTGMARLGLNYAELKKASAQKKLSNIVMLMSHLSCASDASSKNEEQLERLNEATSFLPNIPVSFVNSSGHFLSADYHFDLGRPGCALYGINPTESQNPMKHVATLSAPILQIRELDRDEEVGYGATYKVKEGSKLAIAGLGYSDGYLRSFSNKGFAYIGEHKVPFAGRVSMDVITLDVTNVPDNALKGNLRAEFINTKQTVDDIAKQAGTIGYEIYSRLGRRIVREYI